MTLVPITNDEAAFLALFRQLDAGAQGVARMLLVAHVRYEMDVQRRGADQRTGRVHS